MGPPKGPQNRVGRVNVSGKAQRGPKQATGTSRSTAAKPKGDGARSQLQTAKTNAAKTCESRKDKEKLRIGSTGSGTADVTRDLVLFDGPTTNDNGDHDEKRRRVKCCNCGRGSTCSRVATSRQPGCPCRTQGRRCTSCDCYSQCNNKQNGLACAARKTVQNIHKFCTVIRDGNTGKATTQHPPKDPPRNTQAEVVEEEIDPPPEPEPVPEPAAEANDGVEGNDANPEGTPDPPPDTQPVVQPPAPPEVFTEEGADLPGYTMSVADQRLDEVFGDHLHNNDGRHLAGGIADDAAWQRRWHRLAEASPSHYQAPQGREGRRIVRTLAAEWQGVIDRKWNSERPLVFVLVVLQTKTGVRRSRDIRRRIASRIDEWDKGNFDALVEDTLAELVSRKARDKRSEDARARLFNRLALTGRLRKAVRGVTDRESGGPLHPDDLDSKSGNPVISVLRDKYPDLSDPDPSTGIAFEPYPNRPQPLPTNVPADIVEEVAGKLNGSAGLSGTDAVDAQHMLLRFGAESEELRIVMGKWTEWLANGHPPWAAIRAAMALRGVALDKDPGVRPLGIGEIWRRLWAKCLLRVCGKKATKAADNLNLCCGLPCGIEGAIHALNEEWDAAFPHLAPSVDAPPVTAEQAPATADEDVAPPLISRGQVAAEEEDEEWCDAHTDEHAMDAPSPTPDGDGGTAAGDDVDQGGDNTSREGAGDAVSTGGGADDPNPPLKAGASWDARNGFNMMSRKSCMWTAAHRWAEGARFAFNCYRHAAIVMVRRAGLPAYILLSREGVAQGDPLGMILYGICMLPLAETLREHEPGVVNPMYADDVWSWGEPAALARVYELLKTHGPPRGFHVELEKTVIVTDPSIRDSVKAALGDLPFKYADGARCLGGFLGTRAAKDAWLAPQIEGWQFGVERLATLAKRFPQTAFAGLSKALQSEWRYVQRTVSDCGDAFSPVEEALSDKFLPSIFGDRALEEKNWRELLAEPVKGAGLGVPNPVTSADDCHGDSVAATGELTRTLRAGERFDAQRYAQDLGEARRKASADRRKEENNRFRDIVVGQCKTAKRRLSRARQTGSWLTLMPLTLNGTELSAEEFRDNLRLRYGMLPKGLPHFCDVCPNVNFSVPHALSCKTGGLINLRHNALRDEWHQMCATAHTPGAVSDEPLIHSGQDSTGSGGEVGPEKRGDVAVNGFWRKSMVTIFDVRVTDVDQESYRHRTCESVLKSHEAEKTKKYADACRERRRQFTPLVFSVDGLRGKQADAACKKLAADLSKKTGRPYSEVCGYVRSRCSVSLARSVTTCLRGARDHYYRVTTPQWDSGSGLGLYR